MREGNTIKQLKSIGEFSTKFRSRLVIGAYEEWLRTSQSSLCRRLRILDVGCGNAVVTDELWKRFGFFMVGTDLMDYRKLKIPFKVMTGRGKLPFADKEFDVCLLTDVLHHCENPVQMLKEAARVGSRILIFEERPTFIAKIADMLINRIHNPEMNPALNIKAPSQWEAYFEELGLDFEHRGVKRPFLYPFSNFAFNLKQREN